jgi:hypothetical protein
MDAELATQIAIAFAQTFLVFVPVLLVLWVIRNVI